MLIDKRPNSFVEILLFIDFSSFIAQIKTQNIPIPYFLC